MRSKNFNLSTMALIFASISMAMVVISCADDAQSPPTEPPVTIEPTETYTPVPGNSIGCTRPYASTSLWNTPINWDVAKMHTESNLMMAAFFEGNDWIGSDTAQYAPPVYYVTNDTPLVLVQMVENSFRDAIDDVEIKYGEPGGVVRVPIPPEAQPAPGTDAQLAIINLDTGEEWGIIYGKKDAEGNWYAGGVYRYHIKNSGIPPAGFYHRGGGIGQLAGLVRPCEVEQGVIDHAVTLAYDFPCGPDICALNGWPYMIPPFTLSDGKGESPYDIPEGARIVIRPDITVADIRIACQNVSGCIAWVQAMQKYGGFIVDNGGHPKTYAEGDATAHWNPKIWSKDMLQFIPKNWYAVLDWNTPFASKTGILSTTP